MYIKNVRFIFVSTIYKLAKRAHMNFLKYLKTIFCSRLEKASGSLLVSSLSANSVYLKKKFTVKKKLSIKFSSKIFQQNNVGMVNGSVDLSETRRDRFRSLKKHMKNRV